ncbi:MAG: hypothetical protein ACRD2Z_07840 [Thermoanaerobaculia bacterium]
MIAGTLLLRRDSPARSTTAPPPRLEGEIALVLPVEIEADAEHAWARLGMMALIAERLRTAGQAVVPSETVIALLRGGAAEPGPDEPSRIAAAAGARLVLSAEARVTGTRWTVSLRSLLGTRPALTAVGESHDLLEAARIATDGMAVTLGLTPAGEAQDGEPGLRLLLQRIEAARLAQQMDVAGTLIDEAPASLRRHPPLEMASWVTAYGRERTTRTAAPPRRRAAHVMQMHTMVWSSIMRTTITIDTALLEDLKKRASQRGTTVSRLIEDSVRFAVLTSPEKAQDQEAFELVTYGRGGRFTDLDVDKTSALLEREDLERFGVGRGR